MLFFLLTTVVNLALFDLRHYVVPLLLTAFTVIFAEQIHLSFNLRHLLLSLKVSFLILIPFCLIPYWLMFGAEGFTKINQNLEMISFSSILYMLFLVSLPEELFFRGYALQSLGKDFKANSLTSLLFAFAHVPNLLLSGDFILLLTFFPSLVMGWLYIKTQNVLPSTVFHFLSNLCFMLLYQDMRFRNP